METCSPVSLHPTPPALHSLDSSVCSPVCRLLFLILLSCLPVPRVAFILNKTPATDVSACHLLHLGPPSLLQRDTEIPNPKSFQFNLGSQGVQSLRLNWTSCVEPLVFVHSQIPVYFSCVFSCGLHNFTPNPWWNQLRRRHHSSVQPTITLPVAFAICAKWWQEGIASFLGRFLEHKPKGLGKKTHCYDKHYFLSVARPLRVTCHLLGQSSGRLLQHDAKGETEWITLCQQFSIKTWGLQQLFIFTVD